MKKKLIALTLTALMGFSVLAGCGGNQAAEGGDEAAGESTEPKIVRHNLGADPQTIDPALNTAVDGAIFLVNVFEGLCRTDENEKAIPGMAESWEVSEDGLTYTFKLRDAKWSDGEPVKAQDFEFAWKRALDPTTAAEYAYQMYYLKGGEAFNSGEATVDEVGVKAIDDKTLEVVLESPTPYFLELTAFPTYFPVRKDIVEADPEGWALNMETYISNGPFKAVEWSHNDVLKVVKNENYYDADSIQLDGIDFYMIVEESTGMSAYESGEIDYLEHIPTDQIPTLQESHEDFEIQPYLGTYFYVFNTTKEPVNDPKVRKALTLAIDRQAIVDVVTKGGQKPASGFVPPGMTLSDGSDFREKGGDYGIPATANVEEAKKLLAEAGYPDGQGFPTIEVMYNTLEAHKAIAEAIQEMWKQNLGINVELRNEEWKVFQETRNQGDFIIARHGWIGDYVDPMTFLDMWLSNSGNNDADWFNDEYDKLIADSKKAEGADRDALMLQAEKLMMDANITMPIYYYTKPTLLKSYVKGVHFSPLGFVFYHNATIEK